MGVVIPCKPDGAARWSQRTALAGRDYQLSFDWIERAGRWLLALADQDGTPIRDGVALVAGRPLLRGLVDARRPPGELLVLDGKGLYDLDPGFLDLGSRFLLMYFDPGELP